MYQRLVFIGNLGNEPELRFLPSGTAVCNFSTANNHKKKDGSETTTWFYVAVYGDHAEACKQYLHKGSKVLVEGYIVPDEFGSPKVWTDKTGASRANYNVNASVVEFLDRKADVAESDEGVTW
jgi:single-strand DNA-binding protein